jgi:uncharacterized membrane protein YeaQ/YmgE (transglycosylase-associated protein family)
MDITALLIILAIGAVAGWLAGVIMKGGGFGLIADIIIGIVGAFVGGWLFGQLGISIGTGIVNSIVTATVGAIVLIAIIRMIKKVL